MGKLIGLTGFLKRSRIREAKLRELKAPACLLENEQRIQRNLIEKLLTATVQYERDHGIPPPSIG
jgi:hypothetical protein